MIACDCAVCRSTDPRDKRLRPSIYLDVPSYASILVDAGPDLRQQALTFGVNAPRCDSAHARTRRPHPGARRGPPLQRHQRRLDSVLRKSARRGRRCGGRSTTSSTAWRGVGGGIPEARSARDPRTADRAGVSASSRCRCGMAPMPVLGFRFGDFAYLTDCNRIDDSSMELVDGRRHAGHRCAARAAARARTSAWPRRSTSSPG